MPSPHYYGFGIRRFDSSLAEEHFDYFYMCQHSTALVIPVNYDRDISQLNSKGVFP